MLFYATPHPGSEWKRGDRPPVSDGRQRYSMSLWNEYGRCLCILRLSFGRAKS